MVSRETRVHVGDCAAVEVDAGVGCWPGVEGCVDDEGRDGSGGGVGGFVQGFHGDVCFPIPGCGHVYCD